MTSTILGRVILAAACTAGLLPVGASAQSVGVALRAGTLGVGGEVAVGVHRLVGVRVGVGALPISYTGDFEDVRYHVVSTSPLTNIGIDLYPGLRALRLGAGVIFIHNPTSFDARFSGTVTINGQDYSDADVGTLTGALNHGTTAPYVLVGFGRQTNRGIGLFLDLGAAFLDDQRFTHDVTGPLRNDPAFQAELAAEARRIEDEINDYAKIFPILSLGVRFGIR